MSLDSPESRAIIEQNGRYENFHGRNAACWYNYLAECNIKFCSLLLPGIVVRYISFPLLLTGLRPAVIIFVCFVDMAELHSKAPDQKMTYGDIIGITS